ncbi:MAG: 1-(5-phosphoribosyl)-5-[(5-phosphoribosylamino)methylideneamino]imidazole-4-carboxamide isomerase [Halanaerobiales bacterium]
MIILPAIDLKEGKVVRLEQGDFNKETVYSSDPVRIATQFENKGAGWLHIVDLDGASAGESRNFDLIKKIRKRTDLSIQTGGGIRSINDVKRLIEAGINRVILGTLAVKNSEILSEIIEKFGSEKILVSIDAHNGKVATSGWRKKSNLEVLEFARALEQKGVMYILYTDIKRDGMLVGPDFAGLKELKKNTGLNIIASGGISSLNEIVKLADLGFYGVITGQALYKDKIDLKDAIEKVGG